MATPLDGSTFENRYNNVSTGKFKTNTTKDIVSTFMRDLVSYIVSSFMNITDHFINSDSFTSASITNVNSALGTKNYIDNRTSAPASVDTTGGTITLDFNTGTFKNFYGSGNVGSGKIIAVSNITKASKGMLFLNLTSAIALTFPANYKHQSFASGWAANVWTAPAAGYYRIEMSYDGTDWLIDIYGDYTT